MPELVLNDELKSSLRPYHTQESLV